jgi:hypothetical protein
VPPAVTPSVSVPPNATVWFAGGCVMVGCATADSEAHKTITKNSVCFIFFFPAFPIHQPRWRDYSLCDDFGSTPFAEN